MGEPQKQFTYTEPELVSELTLRLAPSDTAGLACDSPAETEISSEKSAGLACGVHSEAETTPVIAADDKPPAATSRPLSFNPHEFAGRFSQSEVPILDRHRKAHLPMQLFNTVYFSAAAAAIGMACLSWHQVGLSVIAAFFCSFAVVAAISMLSNRVHPADFEVTLSRKTRQLLRAGALLLPLPFFALAIGQGMSDRELQMGEDFFSRGEYQKAQQHFQSAAFYNPVSEEALSELADTYNFTYDYDKSLEKANAAIQLNPDRAESWASKAWALSSKDRFEEALAAAQSAVRLDPENGQANHVMAEALLNLGRYEEALSPANEHIRVHNDESSAYELRADIYEKLGKTAEAEQDRAKAAQLESPADNS